MTKTKAIVVTNPDKDPDWDYQENVWVLEVPSEALPDAISEYIELLRRTPDWGDSDEADNFWHTSNEEDNNGD